ncbi:hypothetical protein [Thermoplasma volcanium]|nr:hypothetical protein [Thermoplasma volcanium]
MKEIGASIRKFLDDSGKCGETIEISEPFSVDNEVRALSAALEKSGKVLI